MNSSLRAIASMFCLSSLLLGCSTTPVEDESPAVSLEESFEHALNPLLLEKWFPAVVDEEAGGYFSTFDAHWQPVGEQEKFIVSQARHLWTSSHALMYDPEVETYKMVADHGFPFLRDKMWDSKNGGFFSMVDRQGNPVETYNEGRKIAYGNAFGIYGLAAYYKISEDPEALALAQKAFQWLEDHAHDPQTGGYFQDLSPEGRAYGKDPETAPSWRLTLKDQNSSIHLLEAFTELYQVWPDELVKTRVLELMHLIRDTITHEKGYMRLFFFPDWTPVSYRDSSEVLREANYAIDHVSFGHDIETAFLLLEAAQTIDEEYDKTLQVAKKMVDHSLDHGFDHESGGIYERGYYFAGVDTLTLIDKRKNWWAQAEGMHSLLLFSYLFPEETRYKQAFEKQWAYIQEYLIDQEHGGWYSFGLDVEPEAKEGRKGNIWKTGYHTGRALMNCLKMLHTGEAFSS